ncbi:MAG: hypothetical protein ACI8YW_000695 [Flavobacteriaceae bacterium]|jgi:hypothetical protein
MTVNIKNMVSNRCKMFVKTTLEKLGLHPVQVELGEVVLEENDIFPIKEQLKKELQSFGFELLDDKKTKTIEKIKNRIVDLVQNKNSSLQITLSDYLTQELHQDYSTLSEIAFQLNYSSVAYLSNQFKKVTGLTPSHFKKMGTIKRRPLDEL